MLDTISVSPTTLLMEQMIAIQREIESRKRDDLRQVVWQALRTRIITPKTVAAFAALHLADEEMKPIVPAAHHWLWLRFQCDIRIKKLLLIAPPETAKTTWTVGAYGGTYITVYPERSLIIGSVSGSVAEKRSMSLKNTVLSAEYQMNYPHIQPAKGMTFSSSEWSIAPYGIPYAGRLHPTVAAYGTGGSVIGSRADLVIADDLLDFENSRTAHGRTMVETWLHTSLLSRQKSKTGRAIIIGTAWNHDDIYAKARLEGGWVIVHTPLLSETDHVYATISYPDEWEYELVGERVGTHQALVNV